MSELCDSAHMCKCLARSFIASTKVVSRVCSLCLERNRTPSLRDGWRAVWSYRWRSWSLSSSPVVGDKSPPASPVYHCQQDWWGSESVASVQQGLDVQHMTISWMKSIRYSRKISGIFISVVIGSLLNAHSVVTWCLHVLHLLKVCLTINILWAVCLWHDW